MSIKLQQEVLVY